MVRPVINVSNRETEMALKTLKLSYDTQCNVRAPMVWEKPTANFYDYHYEIGGLYYQPMISYCVDREGGGRRKVVDIPDRILSNYDKRSYKFKNEEPDYENFLTSMHQRRMKDVHSRSIHVANEKMKRSKKNTELGMIRGAAMMRDKYLNQVQLMYTEKVARDGTMRLWEDDEIAAGHENKQLVKKKNDTRYGPSFERITTLESENFGRVEAANVARAKSLERTTTEESTKTEETSSSKTVRVIKMSNVSGESTEEFVSDKRKSLINKDFLAADNMKEFLDVRNAEMKKKEATIVKQEAPLFQDATYSKAMYDVKRRVKKEGAKTLPTRKTIDDIQFHYRGRTVDEVGRFEKASIRKDLFKMSGLPDFDIGYDVV